MCILTSQSSFPGFCGSLSQWWDSVCTMEKVLLVSYAALVSLPSSHWQMCWGISTCLLVGVLELEHAAPLLLFSQAFPGGPYWGKVNLEVNMITVIFDSQTGKCLQRFRLNSFIPFPCQHCWILKRHNNMATKQCMYQGDHRADKITAPMPQGSLRFNSEACVVS